MLIIPVSENAGVKMLVIDRYTYDYFGSLQIVGVLAAETVTIEQPKVAVPDEANDVHWTPIKSDGVTWQLTANDNAFTIPGRMIIRVNKPASPGNAFGVSYA
jgi:hypothetical protein